IAQQHLRASIDEADRRARRMQLRDEARAARHDRRERRAGVDALAGLADDGRRNTRDRGDGRGRPPRLVLSGLEIDGGDRPLELGPLLRVAQRQIVELAAGLGALTLELRALALEPGEPRALIEQRLAPRDELLDRHETLGAELGVALRGLL